MRSTSCVMADAYRFLVDVNLPKYFSFFNSPNFVHQLDLDPQWDDTAIWNYAKEREWVILSRDTDFYYRCLADPSVKVVQLRLGNIRIRDMYQFFEDHWDTIVSKLPEAQLLDVSRSEISVVIAVGGDR